MKIDQIAFYAQNEEQATKIKSLLGLESSQWVKDHVEGRAIVYGRETRSVAELQFNYSYGIELEILTYISGLHWHMYADHVPLSHIGCHLAPDEDFPPIGANLIQEMWTESHTNPYLIEKRRTYHYRIYDTRDWLGTYLKYIKRIEHV